MASESLGRADRLNPSARSCPLERHLTCVVVADADRVKHVEDEDLTVAYLSGASGRGNGLRNFPQARVRHNGLDLYFRQQVHVVFHATVDLFVALLPAMAAHFRNG